MAKVIMIQGTMSNAGKSLLAAGLCRIFHQDGYRVAPFKSQNMALNSFITREGLEMGRAQVMQAEAAGIEPSVLMNPILLKPTNDTGSQVIVEGEVLGNMSARDYFAFKKKLVPKVKSAFDRLASQYDIIVIEGAGSPAEINLKADDIVNMGLAKLVHAPVLLVGDIDRGGVFAQLVGTIELLEPEERAMVKGMIINKFRGDKTILDPGVEMLEKRTGIDVVGVAPYLNIEVEDEDSLTERFSGNQEVKLLDLAVIRLPRISNFTDFAPLEAMEEVSVRYISSPSEFGNPDAVLLPGTKNTIQDLLWMRQNGLEAKILQHAGRGGLVFGICGGYQMLGLSVSDPDGAEQKGTVKGLGLLPVRTVFRQEKRRTRVQGHFRRLTGMLEGMSGAAIEGYEIHMGESYPAGSKPGDTAPRGAASAKSGEGEHGSSENGHALVEFTEETARGECPALHADGAQCGNVYGCYVHGIFDAPQAAKGFLSAILKKKGYDPERIRVTDWKTHKEEQYDRLADIIRSSLDMEAVYKIIEKGNDAPCIL